MIILYDITRHYVRYISQYNFIILFLIGLILCVMILVANFKLKNFERNISRNTTHVSYSEDSRYYSGRRL